MLRRHAPALMAFVALACLIAPAAHARARSDPAAPDVVVAARGDRNTFFPTIARLQTGALVVVFYDSPSHTAQAGRIALAASTDDGRTWSAPRVVLDTPLDDRDPQVAQTRAGTLLLSWFEYDWAATPPAIIGSFVARSEDGGATWSPPVRVGTALAWAATSAKITELGDGALLLPLYGAAPGGGAQRATVVRSTDDGRTWPGDGEVTIAADPMRDFQEPALADRGGGNLTALLRTGRGDNFAYEADSPDGGRTWLPPVKTDMQAQASDLLSLPGGVLFHTWGDVSGRFAPGRPVVGRLKYPDRAWDASAPLLLYAGTQRCSDASYPSSALLGDGRIFTVYYDACAGYIGGTYSAPALYRPPPNGPGMATPRTPRAGTGGMSGGASWRWGILLAFLLIAALGRPRSAAGTRRVRAPRDPS